MVHLEVPGLVHVISVIFLNNLVSLGSIGFQIQMIMLIMLLNVWDCDGDFFSSSIFLYFLLKMTF